MASVTQLASVQIEQHENYNKGSFRNKCLVRSNQQNQYLIIPLKKGKNKSQPIREVRIAYDEDWFRVMQNRLQTEYGSFPYYSYYIDDIIKIVNQHWDYLFELNTALLKYFFQILEFENYTFTHTYKHVGHEFELDLRDKITPQYFHSNSNLLSKVKIDYFHFVPAHSFIEALFSYGPETGLLLKQYKATLPAMIQVNKDQ